MNIVFEGIDGCGKTSLIKFIMEASNQPISYVDEVEDSPISSVLSNMLQEDPFFELKKEFKTSIFESLLLAADHHYKQEKFRSGKGIFIFDRDFASILVYQKYILKKELGEDYIGFFEPFEKCVIYKNKKVDLFVYVQVPLDVSIGRITKRDMYEPTDDQISFLRNVKLEFENYLIPMLKELGFKILVIDGTKDFKINSDIILKELAL